MGDGKKLKSLLKEMNTNVRQLSKKTGITASTLYSIINRDGDIRYEWAMKIAKALNVRPEAVCSNINSLGEPIDFFTKAEASVPGMNKLTFAPTEEQILKALIGYIKESLSLKEDNAAPDQEPVSNEEWVYIKFREPDKEEIKSFKEYYLTVPEKIYDCELPDDGQEVLITTTDGRVVSDKFINDGECCYFETYCDDDEVRAWRPYPEAAPEKEGEST